VRKRGIEMERKISDDYLTLLGDSYTRLFHNYDAAPVMVVNAENLSFVDNDNDFQLLLQRLESMRGHREYFNKGD
jgi:deoxyadenosine/deoxycytidine kinase